MTTAPARVANALKFLSSMGFFDRRPLATLDPNTTGRPPVVATPGTAADTKKWQQRNQSKNFYLSVNPTKHAMHRKPREHDVAVFQFAHVDCDPLPNETAPEARAQHRDALMSGVVPPPTFVYDSRNGVVGLWKLAPPIKITNDASIARCKGINKALAQQFGGKKAGVDSPYSIDHRLRIADAQRETDRGGKK